MATLAVASIAAFMTSIDMMVVTTAIPALRRSLGGDVGALEWTVNAYLLAFACLLLTASGLGDRFGRRRIFTIGLAGFALASVAAALAPSIGALVAARAAQGAAAALVLPLTLTMISEAFPPETRGRAIGIWGGVTGLGGVLGPILGAGMVQAFGWSWIFWINVPIAIALIPAGLRFVTETFGARKPLDVVGLVLASLGFLAISWGLVQATDHATRIRCGPRRRSSAGSCWSASFLLVGAADPAPDAAARDLPQRPVQRRQRRRLLHLRQPVRRGVPDLAVLPDRPAPQPGARPHCDSSRGRCRRSSSPRWSARWPRSTATNDSWPPA